VKPFFMSIDNAPPIAFRPNNGLFGIKVIRAIAICGIKSQFTTSPNASLMRLPF
jgi:hypothetical protein